MKSLRHVLNNLPPLPSSASFSKCSKLFFISFILLLAPGEILLGAEGLHRVIHRRSKSFVLCILMWGFWIVNLTHNFPTEVFYHAVHTRRRQCFEEGAFWRPSFHVAQSLLAPVLFRIRQRFWKYSFSPILSELLPAVQRWNFAAIIHN